MQNDAEPILSEGMKNKMINYLLTKYDRTMRAQVDQQLKINVNFYVQGMSKVNEVDMDYQMTVFFRQVYAIFSSLFNGGNRSKKCRLIV